jgi:hypothetical protein
MIGARDTNSDKVRKAVEAIGPGVKVGSPAEAAAFGEVVVLSVPWPAVRETIAALGNLSGKILIDPSNVFAPPKPEHGSAAQDIAAWAKGARVVKAFNTMGAETLLNPTFSGQTATAFICGDDASAKKVVLQLASELGLDALDSGPLANAAHVEAMCVLWVSLVRGGLIDRNSAFKLVRR